MRDPAAADFPHDRAMRRVRSALETHIAPMPPDSCTTMREVRSGVDAVDAALIGLLAERFAYMAAAARIKPTRDLVRDEARKRQVIDQAVAMAGAHGVPADFVAQMWEQLVEASIHYEEECFDRRDRT